LKPLTNEGNNYQQMSLELRNQLKSIQIMLERSETSRAAVNCDNEILKNEVKKLFDQLKKLLKEEKEIHEMTLNCFRQKKCEIYYLLYVKRLNNLFKL
jgi:hypothetical protein